MVSDDKPSETFDIWWAAWALSDGIRKFRVTTSGRALLGVCAPQVHIWRDMEGKTWFRTLDAARAHVETMRAERIASLKKQIEELERMQIKVRER